MKRLFVERRYFRRDKQLRFSHAGKTHQVIPDSGFLLQIARGSTGQTPKRPDVSPSLLMHFTELDNGTMSLPRLHEKFDHYHRWAKSERGERYLPNL